MPGGWSDDDRTVELDEEPLLGSGYEELESQVGDDLLLAERPPHWE